MFDLDTITRICAAAPSGKWEIHTSNSWRRVFADQGREKVRVIEPTTQHGNWPDLMFGPGVQEYLENVTPDVVHELCAEVRVLRAYQENARKQVFELMGVVVDIEQFGGGLDDTCMETLKRVMGELVVKDEQ